MNVFNTTNLMRLAAMSYDDDITTEVDTTCVEVKNMFVRIHAYPTGTIIAFRGTDGYGDWFFNLSRMRSRFIGDTSVHAGYLWSMKKVYTQIKDVLTRLPPTDTIHVTGHSLGGAVGLLCAVQLSHEYPDKTIHMTSIGAPRVGDKHFKRWCEQKSNLTCDRIYNPKDIIPRVPYFGYHHIGTSRRVVSSHPYFRLFKAHSIHTYINSYEQEITPML